MSESAEILAVIFLGLSFFIFCLFQGIKAVKESKAKNSGISVEELQLLHEIHDSLSVMEKRIDSLETIIDDSKKEDRDDNG